MSTNEMMSVGNPFARTLPVTQKKQNQAPVQKVDTAREDIKKRLLESFESQSDVIDNEKSASDQLAAEIENIIYDITGKNSRDKSYREKSKKIMSRLKGARNSQLRISLRSGNMTVSEFCKLTDKQLDDDSYFEKLFNNGNAPNVESKKAMTRPPNLKQIPVKKIELIPSFGEVGNDYFENLHQNVTSEGTKEPNESDNNLVTTQENEIRNEPKLVLFSEDFTENNYDSTQQQQSVDNTLPMIKNENLEDSNSTFRHTIEIDTNSVKNLSVFEDINPKQPEIDKFSPKNNGKTIQFNPVSRNQNNTLPINLTFHVGSNRPNFKGEKDKEEEIPNLNVGNLTKASNLEKLKGIMEIHKQKNTEKVATGASFMNQSFNSNSEPIKVFDEPRINPKILPTDHIQKEVPKENASSFENPTDSNNKKEDEIQLSNNRQNNDDAKEIENRLKNNSTYNTSLITSNQYENKFDSSIKQINNNQNFYDEEEKELNSIKPADDIRETKSVAENLKEKLNSRYISPRNETRSNYTNSRIRNPSFNNLDQSMSSMKERYKSFCESKATLETNIELANKKCEIYEKEIYHLRQLVNDLKLQMSRTNEDTHKLEITRLRQTLGLKEKENQILVKENNSLKKQFRKYEENTNQLIEDNRLFRLEAEKKFNQYNKEIENLTNKMNELASVKNHEKDRDVREDKRQNELEKKENTNLNLYDHYNYMNDYGNKINFPLNTNINNQVIATELKLEHENNNEINLNNDESPVAEYDHYDHNNFTNGNPNIIEEVGADNYLNMNGNTYDEMKDARFESDNLHDHQYYDEMINLPRANNQNTNFTQAFDPIEAEIQTFNKKPNIGDNFNFNNSIVKNNIYNNNKAESGATNNIFNQLEEEKEELENVFNTMDVPDSINTSLSLEKQKSVHSKKNSNMNHANLLKSDHLKNHHPFENKFNVATNPTITSTNIISNPLSKKENKINVAPQIIKPAHKISIDPNENSHRFNSLFEDTLNENVETSVFNTKPVIKGNVKNPVNRISHLNPPNVNKVNHINSTNKRINLNDNPFDNFNNDENIWETISNNRENTNNIFD